MPGAWQMLPASSRKSRIALAEIAEGSIPSARDIASGRLAVNFENNAGKQRRGPQFEFFPKSRNEIIS